MKKLTQKEIEQFDFIKSLSFCSTNNLNNSFYLFISKKSNENKFLGDDLANLFVVSPGP